MCNLFRIILEGKYAAVAAVTGVPALASIKNRLYGSCSHFSSKRAGSVDAGRSARQYAPVIIDAT